MRRFSVIINARTLHIIEGTNKETHFIFNLQVYAETVATPAALKIRCLTGIAQMGVKVFS